MGSVLTGFSLRLAAESDRTYLSRLFFLTDVFGDESQPVGDHYLEDLERYVGRWTPGQGGVIALSPEGIPAGGVWLRHGPGRPAFGFVAEDVPELVIAVENRYAGQGLGSSLIDAALTLARAHHHAGVSLAVDFGNDRARALYVKKGFRSLGARPDLGCEAMIHRLQNPPH
ncbi:GNAT family N-acetyltransferase [Corynebacterium comes]|uniref:Mycothiol acetyltransferase n=1 Tax=Corynebacterium comes TaxID=2675218 RepID=A0A6B8WAH2_9CORY|nr:GNAT family N-acetyltransferase [Corynebacterium comes]QGU03878.1 Mycothiol acetyltransferase [Corynebacterium comes]